LPKNKQRKKAQKRRRVSQGKQRVAPTRNEAVSSLGRTGLAVGRAGEERVLKAFLHVNPKHAKHPSWWQKIRKATPEEDAQEVDCAILTDVGEIYLQIKTSLTKREAGRPIRTERNDIRIVYINLKDSDAEIRRKVRRAIITERKRILKNKNASQ